MTAPRWQMAEDKAAAVLSELKLGALPIDPFAVAIAHDITVQAKPQSAGGVSGMLLRHGDCFGIMYATHVSSEGFQRFSVAHELGHFFLPGHPESVFDENGIHESRAGFTSGNVFELEADRFAATLLMPKGSFKVAMKTASDGLAGIEALASLCRASLVATALRYADLAKEPIAVIVSNQTQIEYCALSTAFRAYRDLSPIRRGQAIPRRTATSLLASDPRQIIDGDREEDTVDLAQWFGAGPKKRLLEEVIGLGNYGKILTVLTLDESEGDPEDDEDDEALMDSWTPRFR